ncbi:hypothetical protein PAXRUDRAFT_828885 [Paxillus rubicundulus Ve08.2h10]|uniref:ZW10 C-terminal helical domain-containing protein n=1 Tax=Paxillus rubicundulus Ve08.2h10 TaxID=930991 RepID=A0A0D0E0S1_9AGAM|nr:hypothetical protein PAXRUDRAFT_828885 [Paxillus rubicundulus Ve08.2h10]
MAFLVPSHLPRKDDVSSQILSKLDSVTFQTLDSAVASSWRTELDESIRLSKKQIHDRIHADLPAFEAQLVSAKSAQQRLCALSSDVDALHRAVRDPESGTTPVLLEALRRHQALAQASLNADVMHASLLHLSKCKAQLESIQKLVESGDLPAAVPASTQLSQLLEAAPAPLSEATITMNIKTELRVLTNRVEELLSNAYTQSVVVSSTQVLIKPSIILPNSQTPIPLSALLSSLSSSALSAHMTSLRRDVTTHYIDYSLDHPTTLTVSKEPDQSGLFVHKMQRCPPPPTSCDATRLGNLSRILDFFSERLFPCLPQSQRDNFPRSLSNPLITSIMTRLLIPSLPSKLEALPAFLELAKDAVDFEARYLNELLKGNAFEREIKGWVDNVCAHYERGRRLHILDGVRAAIRASSTGGKETFSVELVTILEIPQTNSDAKATPSSVADAWSFDDSQSFKTGSSKSTIDTDDAWGFDEEVEAPEKLPDPVPDLEPDPSDAWGWNNDEPAEEPTDANTEQSTEPAPEEPLEEDGVWDDDPWGDDSGANELAPPGHPPTTPSIPPPQPIPALLPADVQQKISSNGYQQSNGHGPNGICQSSKSSRDPSSVSRELYSASVLTKHVIQVVEDALHEGKALESSGIFAHSPTSTSPPGTLIMQSSALVLDLYRALYPVVAASRLSQPAGQMQFSNDCHYLSEEVNRVLRSEPRVPTVKAKLEECRDDLKVLADSWFYLGIEKQVSALGDILAGTDGFTDTSDQECYDECEMAITRVLRDVRSVAHTWKFILPKSKYYVAVGMVVDGVLSQILEDILAISDIPEVESHKLSELCRILSALEGLFVENTSESSFVVSYVPSWLKFSYLSELLEASMADLTYLFEEGALVDFEIDELAQLVRALFADTPLRTKTLDKIMGGHPVR